MNTHNDFFHFGQILSAINPFQNSFPHNQSDSNSHSSAVAVIIKKNNSNYFPHNKNLIQDQILFLQRKISSKDKYSGEICFPGGRQQPNQNLLHTAIRQTFQETNLKIKPQRLLGCINRPLNVIISTKKALTKSKQVKSQDKPKSMVVYGFIFYVSKQEIDQQTIKLNKDEIQIYKWVPVNDLMNSQNLCWHDDTQKILNLAKSDYESISALKITHQILDCIERAYSPALDIKMSEKLYGLTLYIVLIILSQFIKCLESLITESVGSVSQEKNYLLKRVFWNSKLIKERCQPSIVFTVKKPITDGFRKFETAFHQTLFKMRPKL